MNWDWPGGVWFWRVTVSDPWVASGAGPGPGVIRRSASTDRYWSSLLPPRLSTATWAESDESWPPTPPACQALSAEGSADQSRRWRPEVAEVMASARFFRSSDSLLRAFREAVAMAPRRSTRTFEVSVSERPAYWSWVRYWTTLAASREVPSGRTTGPVTWRNWRRVSTSTARTPSTCWPVTDCHIRAARGPLTSNWGVRPRLRQSTPG